MSDVLSGLAGGFATASQPYNLVLLFAACVWVYARTTRPIDRIGTWSLVALVVFLVLVYIANVLGPPPPGIAAVAWSAQAIWLLVAWGYWIDRHRAASRN